jgi:hypothetical protein
VARRRRNPEVIAGRVNADGSVAAGDGFTVVKTGTGAHTLTFGPGFRFLSVSGQMIGGAGFMAVVSSAERSVNIQMYNTAAAATDLGFTFIAVGVQQ